MYPMNEYASRVTGLNCARKSNSHTKRLRHPSESTPRKRNANSPKSMNLLIKTTKVIQVNLRTDSNNKTIKKDIHLLNMWFICLASLAVSTNATIGMCCFSFTLGWAWSARHIHIHVIGIW